EVVINPEASLETAPEMSPEMSQKMSGDLPSSSSVEAGIAQLLKSLPKSPDKVVVSLRSGQNTFRNLNLPTRDKKAIQAGVNFELEDDLPFPTDESVHDYAILSQAKQNSTVHVA